MPGGKTWQANFNLQTAEARWQAILCVLATILLAFCIRLIEYGLPGESRNTVMAEKCFWLPMTLSLACRGRWFRPGQDHPMAEMRV